LDERDDVFGFRDLASARQIAKLLNDGVRLDMVGSNNTIIVALAKGANIEFAGSNNAITWTSPDGKEPVVRHLGSGNTLTAGR